MKGKQWLVLLVSLTVVLLANNIGITRSSFVDLESSSGNSFQAWASTQWVQTTQAHFDAGVLNNVNTAASPDNVKLATKTDWYDASWQYRMPIYITNTNPSTLTNYQVRITLQTTNFNYSHAKTNGEDIRFIDSDGITQCDYWIETWNASGTSTLWVEVPTLIGYDTATIYMYYGNPGASAASNGAATFQFFDDFPGTSIDTSKWTGDTGSCSVADSVVTLTVTNGDLYVYSKSNYGPNIRIRSKEQRPEASGTSLDYDADVGVKTNGSWTDAVRIYNYGSPNWTYSSRAAVVESLMDSGIPLFTTWGTFERTWKSSGDTNPPTPVVQNRSSGSQDTDSTSHPITMPSGIQAGELLIIVFSVDGNPTCTANGGFTTLAQSSYSTTVTGAIFYKFAQGGDTCTITTSASEQSTHVVLRISGATFNAAGLHASATGSSTNSNPPSLTPAGGAKNYLWLATRSGDSSVVATAAPTNYTNLQSKAGGTNGASTNTAERARNAATEDPGTFTSASEQWVCWTIAVPPNYVGPAKYSINDSTPMIKNYDIPAVALPVLFRAYATSGHTTHLKLDWIFVSQYKSPEPSAGLGSEEGVYVSSGTLASQVLDTGVSGARWDALFWDETLPSNTDITFAVRASDNLFAKDAEPNPPSVPDWVSVGGTSPVTSGLPSGHYMQWRATLTASDTSETPILHEVRVYHY